MNVNVAARALRVAYFDLPPDAVELFEVFQLLAVRRERVLVSW